PGMAQIGRVKDSGCGTAGAEENLLAGDYETTIARGEYAFAGQRRSHVCAGQWIPMLAIKCAQQEKFAVDGIAKREAASFRVAGDRVEKKLLALVRVLKPPRFAAVGRLVRSEEHTSELQSRFDFVCRLLHEQKETMRYMKLSL